MTTQPIELRMHAVGPWPMTSYALVCPETQASVLIDPGADPAMLTAMLGDTRPVAILLTHSHPDHVGALDAMRAQLGVPVLAHPGPHVRPIHVDHPLADGEIIALGGHRLRTIYTPGHTADMISIAVEGEQRVVVGDTLFDGGPGKTWSVADFETTLATLRNTVLHWPDSTICFPGHGPSFVLGERRAAIEGFLARDHHGFFGDATWEHGC